MAEQPERKPIEPGIMARLLMGVSDGIKGATEAWFGPYQPLPPVAQEESKGRQFDYLVAQNMLYTPKQGVGVSFSELRGLADSCTLLRLAIETRKDQMESLKWDVRLTESRDADTAANERLRRIRNVLKRPNGIHSYAQWMRMLLEDYFVIDAVTIEPRFDGLGRAVAFDPIDGSTITPLIDEGGRRPEPPNPAYMQILKGVVANHLNSDELIYYPRNTRTNKVYGFSPVEQLIMYVNIALRRDIHKLQYYTEGTVPDSFFELPPDVTSPEQVAQFQEYFDKLMAGDTAYRRKMKFMPGGGKYVPTKDQILQDTFDEWLARLICYCFSLSPTAFVNMGNRAQAETIQQEAREQGLKPLMIWWADLMTYIIQKYLGEPEVEFVFEKENSDDVLKSAQADEILLRSGVKSLDEVRKERGMEGVGASKPMITLSSGIISVADAVAGKAAPIPPAPAIPQADTAPVSTTPEPIAQVEKADLKKKLVRLKVPHNPKMEVEKARLTRKIRHAFRGCAYNLAQEMVKIYPSGEMDKIAKFTREELEDAAKKCVLVVEDYKYPEITDLQPALARYIKSVAVSSSLLGMEQVGVDSGRVGYIEQKATDYAVKRSAELVGMKWTGTELINNPRTSLALTGTTREALKSTISQAVSNGWTADELRDNLVENFTFSENRAGMIARTELSRAHNAGLIEAWKESGVVKGKEWVVSQAHSQRDNCDKNASQGAIPWNSVFASGDMMPPEHPNCQCMITAVMYEGDAGGVQFIED